MLNDRLPKKLLFGQVKGCWPPGCPRSDFNGVSECVTGKRVASTDRTRMLNTGCIGGQDAPRSLCAGKRLDNDFYV